MGAKFIHKRREYLGKIQTRYGFKSTFSRWETYYAADTKERAQQSINDHPSTGMWVHAIFHGGKTSALIGNSRKIQ